MTRHPFRSAIASSVAYCAVVVMTFPAAAADSADDEGGGPGRSSAMSATGVTNFKAGYLSTVATADLKAAEVTFVLPALTCTDHHEVVAIGIGDEPESGIFQWLSIVWLICEDGEASYGIRSRVGSVLEEGVASAGDRIRASATRMAEGRTHVTTTNLTTGEEVIAEGIVMPDEFANDVDFGTFPVFLRNMYPVPEFGTVKLTHATMTSYSSGRTCLAGTEPVRNTRNDKKTGELEIDTTQVKGCRFAVQWLSH